MRQTFQGRPKVCRMRYVVVLAAVLLSACGGGPGGNDAEPSEPPAPRSELTAPDRAPGGKEAKSITGTFGGDAQLEGGCAWVEDGGTKWQVQWPDGYSVSFEPLTLNGPSGPVAEEGAIVTVTGRPQSEAITICQVGPLWQATDVTVAGR